MRHPGILLNLLMSTHQIVGDALDPLEVGVAGVVGEMGEPKIIGAEGGGHEKPNRRGGGDENDLTRFALNVAML